MSSVSYITYATFTDSPELSCNLFPYFKHWLNRMYITLKPHQVAHKMQLHQVDNMEDPNHLSKESNTQHATTNKRGLQAQQLSLSNLDQINSSKTHIQLEFSIKEIRFYICVQNSHEISYTQKSNMDGELVHCFTDKKCILSFRC